MSMITATTWVPRGFPAQHPTKAEFNAEEFERIQELANLQLQDAKDGLEEAQANGSKKAANGGNNGKIERTNAEIDDDLKEYDLEHYDDSADEADDDEMTGSEALGMFGSVKNLVYHDLNDEDPYITRKEEDAESDSDREDLQVLLTDNMILAARVEDEIAHLEIYVYEDDDENLYVHHDHMLPAIPLCVEWLHTPVASSSAGSSTNRNLVAVGTMDPDIELWDLDTVDSVYPLLILGAGGVTDPITGAIPTGKKKKRKALAASKIHKDHHTASVLSLASNRNHANLLASASADTTVKLWDLASSTPSVAASSYPHHTDKVCSLSWHPTESTALLSGSWDRTVVAADMRTADGKRTWSVASDVESVKWDPHDSNCFYVATDVGLLYYFDARSTGVDAKPVWRLQAHDEAISAFDVNPHIPGFLATGSADKTVKLWNVSSAENNGKNGKSVAGGGPSLVTTRSLPDTGRIFSTSFAPDVEVAFRLAIAGSKGNLQIWDTSTNKGVRDAFASKMKAGIALPKGDVKERMTGVNDDGSDSDSEEEEEEGEGETEGHGDGWEDEDEDEDGDADMDASEEDH